MKLWKTIVKCKSITALAVLMLAVGLPGLASADSVHGTRAEAQAMCEKAAALIQSEGLEKADKAFQDKNGGFIDRDLYVFVLDDKGVFIAHGAKPILVGKGGMDMVDVDGFALIKAFVAVKDKAWVDYKWPDAAEGNKIEPKSSYIIRVGDHVVGVGYYKL